jgi:hypothetical protein
MSDNLCLDCAYKNNPIFKCTAGPAWKGHSMQQGSIIHAEAEVDPMFGNSDGESPVPMANANIAGWLSGALTNLWMNQQHAEGLLLSILTVGQLVINRNSTQNALRRVLSANACYRQLTGCQTPECPPAHATSIRNNLGSPDSERPFQLCT